MNVVMNAAKAHPTLCKAASIAAISHFTGAYVWNQYGPNHHDQSEMQGTLLVAGAIFVGLLTATAPKGFQKTACLYSAAALLPPLAFKVQKVNLRPVLHSFGLIKIKGILPNCYIFALPVLGALGLWFTRKF